MGQAIGLPLFMALFTFLGLAVTSATVVIYGEAIIDPVQLLGRMEGLVPICISLFGEGGGLCARAQRGSRGREAGRSVCVRAVVGSRLGGVWGAGKGGGLGWKSWDGMGCGCGGVAERC